MRTIGRTGGRGACGPLTACLLALGLACSAEAQAPRKGKEVFDAIEKAWRARQERLKSVDMRWTARETYLRGMFSDNYGPDATRKPGVHPDRDITFDVPAEFSLQGNMARHAYSGKLWSGPDARFDAIKCVTTFDGELTRESYPERERSYPVGYILTRHTFASASHAKMLPLVYYFRPLEGAFFGVALREYSLVNTASKVRNVKCLEIQHRRQGSSTSLWLDPARDYVVVKSQSTENGLPSLISEMRYRNDPANGWVPEGWDTSMMGASGAMYYTERITVNSLTVGVALPKSRFDLEFPARAMVYDGVEDRQWIVRPDGTKRFVSRKEVRIPYQQLLESDAPLNASGGGNFPGWGKIGLALLGCGCLAAFLWRRRRRANRLRAASA